MRTLLSLYPRRIRNRYGDELLDLEAELRAQGEVSRPRLIRDMLAGAVLIRPTRQRACLVTGAVLVIVGLAVAGTIVGGHGTASPARARLAAQSATVAGRMRAEARTANRYGTCFVATGSSCSLTPCTEFIGRSSAADAVGHTSAPATQRQPRVTGPDCISYPHAGPQYPVFVARAALPTHLRR